MSRAYNLGEEYPKQQARLRELLVIYKSLGPTGAFGAAVIDNLLQLADRAVMQGDTVAMIGIFQEMLEIE